MIDFRQELNDAILGVKELQFLIGKKAKLDLIRKFADNLYFKQFLFFALHPLLSYNISENTLRKEITPHPGETSEYKVFTILCRDFSERNALDDHAVRQAQLFILEQPEEHRDLYRKLLSKRLRLGVTSKTVNTVIPNLFPEWEVQQAYPIEKHPVKEGEWFSLSEKLNGIRATYYKGNMIGRSGEIILGLNHIIRALQSIDPDKVYDGELTLKDKTGLSDNEAFRKAAGIINSDANEKLEIKFTVFDIVYPDTFSLGESRETYKHRRGILDEMQKHNGEDVQFLPSLYQGSDQTMIPKLLDQMVSEDKEGLMLNLDTPYKCKRHAGILKIKRFYTMDLPIIRCEPGTGKYENTLGAFVVDFNGSEVGVGSGFTDDQRHDFWDRREDLIGELVEVKYKEISYDKSTGQQSLQFPVFVTIRTDKHDISFA